MANFPHTVSKKIDWVNTIFMLLTPIVAVGGIIALLLSGQGIHGATWLLALAMALATGLAITAGYHRLFAHNSYQTIWPVRLLLLLFGAAAFQNSARKWCSDHRVHHQQVDREADPYNIRRGFWHAHIGWILVRRMPAIEHDNVRDLQEDPLVRLQDRYFFRVAALVGFALPTAIASLWGDPWGGFIVAGVARIVVNHHLTFFINSLCHMVGSRPYSDKNSSRDNWLMALLTYGEGYHNFHHAFPGDYRNGVRAYQWDPTKWLIRCLEWARCAYSVRRIPEARILKARLRMQEKALQQHFAADFLAATRVKVEHAYTQFRALKQEYRALKRGKVKEMRDKLALMKHDIRQAKLAFKTAMADWSCMVTRLNTHPQNI